MTPKKGTIMSALNVFKTVAAIVVSTGAGAIVGNTVKLTTPEDVKLISKVAIAAGGFALSGIVADAASKYTENEIDSTIAQVKEVWSLFGKK